MSGIGWGFHGNLERPGDLAVGYRRWEGVSWRLERPGGLAGYLVFQTLSKNSLSKPS